MIPLLLTLILANLFLTIIALVAAYGVKRRLASVIHRLDDLNILDSRDYDL